MFSPTPYGWISQYFIGFFFAYGVYLPFWGLWFEGQGMSASDIGFLLGLAFATRCISNLVITPRIHRVEHLLPALRLISLLSAVFIVFHLFAGGNLWLLALATVVLNICFGPITPLSDAVANYYSRMKMLDYGRTRLWGSAAFIAGSTIVGYLVAEFGSNMIVYTAAVGMLLSTLLAMRAPNPLPVSESDAGVGRPKLLSILKNREVIGFLVLISLIHGSHAAYYSFSSIYWKSAGHPENIIGYLWSLGVIAEITIFATSKRLFAGWSLRSMFLVASIGCAVRWGLTAGTTEIWALVLIQLLHGVTFAIAHLAAIRFIQSAPANQMVPLQALYNAIPMGAVIAVMTTLSGWGYELWGAGVFWFMAAMGILACFIRVEPKKTAPEPQTQS
ncbi:3-phenylpropionate MFS transporter [Vibrio sp. JC009]|uniref:3-phenylpropionate MFS transporter n=1 Tax=Vibrio sp. JC009 TaxID=2912314 RepID=UPI0023AFF9D9|nr:3-phenylpropionate MFS transporter [Vibrio sp. JC009]WED21675.1 3-phenylpropionate MFS transporter [Vibrio sp. JC009]